MTTLDPKGLKAATAAYYEARPENVVETTITAYLDALSSLPAQAVTWLELREPNCVPERKGPFKQADIASHLRECMDARPAAFITVITQGYDGPLVQDGPECLMMTDGRSTGRAKRHIESSKAAHALAPSQPAAVGVTDEMVERACKAHAPQWSGIDAEIKVYARQQMRAALEAALRSTP